MKSSINQNSLATRQRELQYKLFKALEVQSLERFSSLQAQWVHRFGLTTLPTDEHLKSLFIDEKLDKEIEDCSKDQINKEDTKLTSQDNETFFENPLGARSSNIKDEITPDNDFLPATEKKYQSQIVNDPNEGKIIEESNLEIEESNLEIEESNLEIEESLGKDSLENKQDDFQDSEKMKRISQGNNSYQPAEKTVIQVSPPPQPSLNNLRKWLN